MAAQALDMNQPRYKSPLEQDKLNLYATPEKTGARSPKLCWAVIFNNPRLTVYTNDPALQNKENDWGRITARLDIIVAQSVLELLLKLVDEPNDTKYKVENYNNPITANGERTQTPIHINDIYIGKDKEGIIWLSVVEKDKPKIKFNLEFTDYHHLQHGDGTPVTRADASKLVTRAYCGLLSKFLTDSYFLPDQLAILNTSAEDKKNMRNNRSNQKPTGQKSAPTSIDMDADDLPF